MYSRNTTLFVSALAIVAAAALAACCLMRRTTVVPVASTNNSPVVSDTVSASPFRPTDETVWVALSPSQDSCAGFEKACLGKSVSNAVLDADHTVDVVYVAAAGPNALAKAPKADVVVTFTAGGTPVKQKIAVPELGYTAMAGGEPKFDVHAAINTTTSALAGSVFVKLSMSTGEFESSEYLYRCAAQDGCQQLSWDRGEGGF